MKDIQITVSPRRTFVAAIKPMRYLWYDGGEVEESSRGPARWHEWREASKEERKKVEPIFKAYLDRTL